MSVGTIMFGLYIYFFSQKNYTAWLLLIGSSCYITLKNCMLKNFSQTLQSAHDKPANSKNVWIVSPSIWSSSSLKTRKISLWEKMFSPFIIPNKHRYYRVHNVGSLWWLNRTYCSKSEIEISWLQKPFFVRPFNIAISYAHLLTPL